MAEAEVAEAEAEVAEAEEAEEAEVAAAGVELVPMRPHGGPGAGRCRCWDVPTWWHSCLR